MRRLLTVLVAIFLVSLLVPLSGLANGEKGELSWNEWEMKEDVEPKKEWTITFTHPIDESTFSADKIFVEDPWMQPVLVQVSLGNNGKTIQVLPPEDGYEPNLTYTLYITDYLKSESGIMLSEPVKMDFTIKKQETAPVFVERKDSTNTITFAKDIKELESDLSYSEEGDTIKMDKSSLELQPGDIFILPPTDKFPFGLIKKVISIKDNEDDKLIVLTEDPELEEYISNIDLSQTIDISAEHFKINPELLGNAGLSPQGRGQKDRGSKVEVIPVSSTHFTVVFTNLHMEDIDTTIDGTLDLKLPRYVVDIEPVKVFGIPYNFEFNQMEFKVNEKVDIDLTTGFYGRKADKILIGSMPVPLLGVPAAGLNANIYLNFEVEGEVGLTYGFEQSFDMSIGVSKNKETKKLEPIDDVKFILKAKEPAIVGEATIRSGVEVGIYLMAGKISMADITASADLSGNIKGKTVEFQENKPLICLRHGPSVIGVSSKFKIGEKLDTKWFGDVGFSYSVPIFHMKKELLPMGNCSFKSIKLLTEQNVVSPGETLDLSVKGIALDLNRTNKEIIIPNKYLKFYSDDDERITINDEGELVVSEGAKTGKEVVIQVVYEDPITGGKVKDSIKMEITIIAEADEEPIGEPTPKKELSKSRFTTTIKNENGTVYNLYLIPSKEKALHDKNDVIDTMFYPSGHYKGDYRIALQKSGSEQAYWQPEVLKDLQFYEDYWSEKMAYVIDGKSKGATDIFVLSEHMTFNDIFARLYVIHNGQLVKLNFVGAAADDYSMVFSNRPKIINANQIQTVEYSNQPQNFGWTYTNYELDYEKGLVKEVGKTIFIANDDLDKGLAIYERWIDDLNFIVK